LAPKPRKNPEKSIDFLKKLVKIKTTQQRKHINLEEVTK